MEPSDTIKQRAREIGFDLVGVAPLAAWRDLEFSRAWVEKGYGGEMRYLSNPKRADPRLLLPSAQSVICVGLVYNASLPYSTEVRNQKTEARSQETEEGEVRGWISRYAWGHDYHEAMRARLEKLRAAVENLAPGVETRVYVDTGPIVERAFARLSGVGWMGKNTCLIHPDKGSWFFLGVMLTSLALAPELPAPDRCGSCTRCLEACPTGALVEPYVMDASRCIAYFNIELKDSIPVEHRPSIGLNVFGCDICQDVCPWNSSGLGPGDWGHGRRAATTDLPEFQPILLESRDIRNPTPGPSASAPNPRPPTTLFNPPLEALASLTEKDFRRLFAHSPIKRVKYRGWLRNLCVAMGNSGDRRFVPWLEQARDGGDPMIREHAEWALAKLSDRGN
jgi:epoxyqueuosine reductase